MRKTSQLACAEFVGIATKFKGSRTHSYVIGDNTSSLVEHLPIGLMRSFRSCKLHSALRSQLSIIVMIRYS